jgi:hypothetical protein
MGNDNRNPKAQHAQGSFHVHANVSQLRGNLICNMFQNYHYIETIFKNTILEQKHNVKQFLDKSSQ